MFIEKEDLTTPINYTIGKDNREYVGLVCSHCDTELLEIYVRDQTAPECTFTANCPLCGDKTFKKKANTAYILVPKRCICIMDIIETDGNIHIKLGELK